MCHCLSRVIMCVHWTLWLLTAEQCRIWKCNILQGNTGWSLHTTLCSWSGNIRPVSLVFVLYRVTSIHLHLFNLPCRLPGCPRHDLRRVRFPDDVSQEVQLRRCGFQLPHCSLWPPVGAADARLVSLSGLHRWEDQNWSWKVIIIKL